MVKTVQSLQRQCMSTIVQHWDKYMYTTIPAAYHVDLVECCMHEYRITTLHDILLCKDIFLNLLGYKDLLTTLHKSVQLLIDTSTSFSLTPMHIELTDYFIQQGQETAVEDLIRVSEFFMECGWYGAAGRLLNHLLNMMEPSLERYNVLVVLTHLISTNLADCKFSRAKDAFVRADAFYDPVKDAGFNRGLLFAEEAYRHYCLSNFAEANVWADKALREVDETLDTASCITVLRRTSKVYINTRHFERAESLIKHAVYLAQELYGTNHPVYADTLQDYGFCLLHIDQVTECVVVYNRAVDITDRIFGENNIKSAVAHEDLAYAAYVYDYSYGDYSQSLKHAEISLRIVNKLLAPDHLLHASTSRLRALILEELAFEEEEHRRKEELFREAQDLHNKSLKLCRSLLGEDNIQTAKHYGNLGRLFQSMKMYKSAEKMHKRAIRIKESLLGPDNYELALSLGHLASLYNYDMRRFSDALPLYHRSIEIALKLFGPGFSGLEYDYRGLMHLYTLTNQTEQYVKYLTCLQDWIDLRTDTPHKLDEHILLNSQCRSTQQVLSAVIKYI